MGCFSHTIEQSKCDFVAKYAVGRSEEPTSSHLAVLPHQLLVGQKVVTTENNFVAPIDDKIEFITNWWKFCYEMKILSLDEINQLAKPSTSNANYLLKTQANVERTYTAFLKKLKKAWSKQQSRLVKNHLRHRDFQFKDMNLDTAIVMEFNPDEYSYGGHDEVGIKLVEQTMSIIMDCDITRYSEPLQHYLAVVIGKLTDLTGYGIGEQVLDEDHHYSEYREAIKFLNKKQLKAFKHLIAQLKNDEKSYQCEEEFSKILKDKGFDLGELWFDTGEDFAINVWAEIESIEKGKELMKLTQLSLPKVKRIANEAKNTLSSHESTLLKALNGIVSSLKLKNKQHALTSLESGSDRAFWQARHVYLSGFGHQSDEINTYFQYQAESSETAAFMLNLSEPKKVFEELLMFQSANYCLCLLNHLMENS